MAVPYFQKQVSPTSVIVDQLPQQLAAQLGSGLSVPLQVANNSWTLRSGPDKVKQDILMAIITPVGRHLLQPDYGSTIPYRPFERITPIFIQETIIEIERCIATWIPQVYGVTVDVDTSAENNNDLTFIVQYKIIGTNVNQSLSLPLEGNDIVTIPASAFTINGVPFLQ